MTRVVGAAGFGPLLVVLLSGCTLTTSLDGLTDGQAQSSGGTFGTGGTGTSGTSGTSGANGAAGMAGVAGTAGQSGASGSAGSSGAGSSGASGAAGTGGTTATGGDAGTSGTGGGGGQGGSSGSSGSSGSGASSGTGGTAGSAGCADTICPVTLLSGQNNPVGIAEHGDSVYWVNMPNGGPSEIWRVDKTTNSKHRVDELDDFIGDAFDVAVDDLYVYWSQRSTGQIMRRDLSGGMPLEQYTLHWGVGGYISVLNGRIAATDFREDAPNNGVVQYDGYVIVEHENYAAGISTSGNNIYWSRDYNKLMFTGNDASAPVVPVKTLDGIEALAVDGNMVYWIKDETSIVETNLDTDETTTRYSASSPFFVSDIAVDSSWIYWTEQGNGLVRKLAR